MKRVMMVSALIVYGVALGVVYGILRLLSKFALKTKCGVFATVGLALVFFIGTFILQLFVTDVIFGIGPDLAQGEVSAPSALKYSFISAALAAYLSWGSFRSWAPVEESS